MDPRRGSAQGMGLSISSVAQRVLSIEVLAVSARALAWPGINACCETRNAETLCSNTIILASHSGDAAFDTDGRVTGLGVGEESDGTGLMGPRSAVGSLCIYPRNLGQLLRLLRNPLGAVGPHMGLTVRAPFPEEVLGRFFYALTLGNPYRSVCVPAWAPWGLYTTPRIRAGPYSIWLLGLNLT